MSQKAIRAYLSKVIDNIGEIFEKIAKKRSLDFKCEKSNAEYIEFGGGNKTCTFKIWYMAEVLNRRSFLKVQINFVESMCFPPGDGELSGLLTGKHEELEALWAMGYVENKNDRYIIADRARPLFIEGGKDYLGGYLPHALNKLNAFLEK